MHLNSANPRPIPSKEVGAHFLELARCPTTILQDTIKDIRIVFDRVPEIAKAQEVLLDKFVLDRLNERREIKVGVICGRIGKLTNEMVELIATCLTKSNKESAKLDEKYATLKHSAPLVASLLDRREAGEQSRQLAKLQQENADLKAELRETQKRYENAIHQKDHFQHRSEYYQKELIAECRSREAFRHQSSRLDQNKSLSKVFADLRHCVNDLDQQFAAERAARRAADAEWEQSDNYSSDTYGQHVALHPRW